MDSESEIDDADVIYVRTMSVLAGTESKNIYDVFVPFDSDSEIDDGLTARPVEVSSTVV